MTTTATPHRPAAVSPPTTPPRRRGMLVAVVALVVATVALIVGIWVVYFSSAFATHQVVVVGNRDLTAGQVIAAAAVPLDVPLARQDLNRIAERATTVPAVESAVVRRDWPDTVSIEITERRPVLAVPQPGSFLIVDRHGVAYESRPVPPRQVAVADVDAGNLPLLRDVGTVAAALPQDLRVQVERIKAGSADAITLTLRSGVVVTWGDAADSALKAQVAFALLDTRPKNSIDVSSPHHPATR